MKLQNVGPDQSHAPRGSLRQVDAGAGLDRPDRPQMDRCDVVGRKLPPPEVPHLDPARQIRLGRVQFQQRAVLGQPGARHSRDGSGTRPASRQSCDHRHIRQLHSGPRSPRPAVVHPRSIPAQLFCGGGIPRAFFPWWQTGPDNESPSLRGEPDRGGALDGQKVNGPKRRFCATVEPE